VHPEQHTVLINTKSIGGYFRGTHSQPSRRHRLQREREAIENARRGPMREPPVNAPIELRKSAPVSRGAPGLSSGRSIPQRITLSPEEIQIARTSFTDPT
jgi:hypothetical protein